MSSVSEAQPDADEQNDPQRRRDSGSTPDAPPTEESSKQVPDEAQGSHPMGQGGEAQERSAQVTNNFYGKVDAPYSAFGAGIGGVATPSRRLQGALSDADIRAAIASYVYPAGFDEALEWLRRDRLIVLEGRPGSGRRAGAIALLNRVVDRPPIMLSPTAPLSELAERTYRSGDGYLVIDRVGGDRAAEADVGWVSIADRVRAHRSFLVVTSSVGASHSVQHVTWQRPPAGDLLRAHLTGRGYASDDLDSVVEQLVAAVPADCPLTRLVRLADLISAGASLPEALEVLKHESGQAVLRWFGEPHTRREIAEVTALAFQAGINERAFESRLARLEELIEEYTPGRVRRRTAPDEFIGGRGWADGDGLIGIFAPPTVGAARVVVFKEAAYQQFVITRLWDTCEVWFWDAVRDWLYETVSEEASLEVASGLAWLACASLDEVQTSFLQPWAHGQLGWHGQVTATYVLWYMCRDGTTAPLALDTTIRWANATDIDVRSTAVLALTGELGVSYPHETVRRLWQLIAQSHDLRDTACTALGRLFAVLVDQTQDAGIVLAMLDERRERFSGRHPKPDMRRVTMVAVLATVTVRSYRTGRPAIVEYIHFQPDRLDVVAHLWADLIRHRPLRRRGLIALWQALHALRDISVDPCADARALGLALLGALPANEHASFVDGFARLDRQLRRDRDDSPTDVLLACLDAISNAIMEEKSDNGVSDHRTQDSRPSAEAGPARNGEAAADG
jgi:hypothetical protein